MSRSLTLNCSQAMLFSVPVPYISDASPYFVAVRGSPWAAWLDGGETGRYDIIVAAPVVTLVTRGEETEISGVTGTITSREDPIELLRAELGAAVEPVPEVPFAGGAVGYWGYELGFRYHQMSGHGHDASHGPQMAVGIYDWAIVLDHQQREARLVSRLRYPETEALLADLLEKISRAASAVLGGEEFRITGDVRSNLPPEAYRKSFEKIQRYLHEGDCYQVNLAQMFTAKATGDAFEAYRLLRCLSPAPYAAFLDWPDMQILCASPERFLSVVQGVVQTKPIKGTRARAQDAAEDARLAQDLLQNAKDRAENLMIVDLLRNDFGKSCEAGTVRTPKLFELESYANVHHLVSTVEGRLAKGRDALDILRDCFPGGSITGAPKKRAMEIIAELEPDGREVYCGSIGYAGFDGSMDCNIAIRTMVFAQGEIRCWAGGGIVADSRCEDELQETFDKASAMLEVMRRFSVRGSA